MMNIPGFEIKKTIAKGGMATAYLAVDEAQNRVVALKVLRVKSEGMDQREQRTLIERFKREGQLVASMAHPNIVDVHGVGSSEKFLFIAMEYLGGGDLKTRIEEGLSRGEALDILESIAEALGYAHARNIVHRDVKPSNILFRRDGVPLLSDFGIAKTNSDEVTDLTTIGMLLGSPTYMSPEQAEGRELDARSDLYSLGIILYEMLTGCPPFIDASALKVIVKHAQEPVPPLPSELAIFQPLIDDLLEKDRESRIQSAHNLLRVIDDLRESHADALDGATHYTHQDRTAGELTQLVDGMSAIVSINLEQDRIMLPVSPGVVERVEQLATLTDVTPGQLDGQVEALVSVDPSLAIQIMRIANSRYYRRDELVSDIPGALANLGPRAYEQVLAFVAASKLFYTRASDEVRVLAQQAQESAARIAIFNGSLAKVQGLNPRQAHACGLFYGAGALPTLVWAQSNPKLRHDPTLISQLMKKGQQNTGVLLLEVWQFPQALATPLRERVHGADDQTRETSTLKLAIAFDETYRDGATVDDEVIAELLTRTGCAVDGFTLQQVIKEAEQAFANAQVARHG